MIKIIIEAGSSKVDVVGLTDQIVFQKQVPGGNPLDRNNRDHLILLISQILYNYSTKISSIHYYGAGIVDDSIKKDFKRSLSEYCNPQHVFIESDMIAACIAATQGNRGIVSILGTGSNSCLFDGERIIAQTPSLGYILGDEGSGAYIGTQLIKDYYYNRLSSDIKDEFYKFYPKSRSEMVKELYGKQQKAKFLASFARILLDDSNEAKRLYMTEILELFFDCKIKPLVEKDNDALYFVGSIAYFCKEILNIIATQRGLLVHRVLQKPMDGLIDYHLKK